MKSQKKHIKWIFVMLLIFIIAVSFAVFFISKVNNKSDEMIGIDNSVPSETVNSEISVVSATGVINIGTIEETLNIENMTTGLSIDAVLVSSGETVSEGTPLISFSEQSVLEAKQELESNLRSAELAYRSGKIEYEQSLINAKYNYDSAILKGEQADEVYKETLTSLKNNLEAAEDTYNSSVELLAEYKDAKNKDTYYSDYEVEYYKNLYDEDLAVLQKKMQEWNVEWRDVTSNQRLGQDLQSQYKYILNQLYKVLEADLKNYENALSNYETATAALDYNYNFLSLSMSGKRETYLNSLKNYETGLLSAEKTRQTSKTQAELAESEYEANVEKAKTDFEKLETKYEDAKTDYETFSSCIVDNCFIASEGGTITRTYIRVNGTLSAGSRILTYSDMTNATVSVSVDQSDIAKLSVGDSAICYSSSLGMLSGNIISISPVTQSSSIGSVSYSVTVKITQNNIKLSSNTRVTVLFGTDAANAIDSIDDNFDLQEEFSGGGFDPNKSNGFGGGNMPNMGGFPGFGN